MRSTGAGAPGHTLFDHGGKRFHGTALEAGRAAVEVEPETLVVAGLNLPRQALRGCGAIESLRKERFDALAETPGDYSLFLPAGDLAAPTTCVTGSGFLAFPESGKKSPRDFLVAAFPTGASVLFNGVFLGFHRSTAGSHTRTTRKQGARVIGQSSSRSPAASGSETGNSPS